MNRNLQLPPITSFRIVCWQLWNHPQNVAVTCQGALINILCDKLPLDTDWAAGQEDRGGGQWGRERELWQFNACHWLFAQIIHASARATIQGQGRSRELETESETCITSFSSSSSLLGNWKSWRRGRISQISRCRWLWLRRWLSMSAIGERPVATECRFGHMGQLRVKHFAYAGDASTDSVCDFHHFRVAISMHTSLYPSLSLSFARCLAYSLSLSRQRHAHDTLIYVAQTYAKMLGNKGHKVYNDGVQFH